MLHPFWPHEDAWIQAFVLPLPLQDHQDQRYQQLHLLAAQSFPGDAAEEGMTLDVAHTSTSRAQAIASVKLKQLWGSTVESGNTVRLNYAVLHFSVSEDKTCEP